jgi:CPA1 family monovalent cation:H+ antiporter
LDRHELVIALLALTIVLGVLSKWMRIPYPILLVIGGLLVSLQPGVPQYELAPNLIFLMFLPPLLYAAAFHTHWPAFRKQLRSITLLAVGLVLFTTLVVGWVAHEFLGLPWAVGFLLGAIVSPPDAVAAIAITQQVRVPKIVATILEGESLVNDAAALVAYRFAIAAVLTGTFVIGEAGGKFVLVSVGGIVIGWIGAHAFAWLHRWLARNQLVDTKLNIAITLLTPYALYLPAEHLHVSGVLAVVVAGLWMGTHCEQIFDRELYQEARAVWEMMEFLLNGMIFILIGFQLPVVLAALSNEHSLEWLARSAAIVSGAVILARLVWMFPGAYLPRWLDRQILGVGDPYPPWQYVTVVGWTGMRGVVSLAAALAIPLTLPDEITPFPHRDLVLFLTFWVIFATLVGQGLTLPWLIRRLGVDRRAEREAQEHSDDGSC